MGLLDVIFWGVYARGMRRMCRNPESNKLRKSVKYEPECFFAVLCCNKISLNNQVVFICELLLGLGVLLFRLEWNNEANCTQIFLSPRRYRIAVPLTTLSTSWYNNNVIRLWDELIRRVFHKRLRIHWRLRNTDSIYF